MEEVRKRKRTTRSSNKKRNCRRKVMMHSSKRWTAALMLSAMGLSLRKIPLHNSFPHILKASIKMSKSSNHIDILALDFDGVICASSTESSFSSILAARGIWPNSAPAMDTSEFELVKKIVSNVRPIIETGYENVLIARYAYMKLLEFRNKTATLSEEEEIDWSNSISDDIFRTWDAQFRDKLLAEYDSSKDDLIRRFGSMRDELIATDLVAWVCLNPLYPVVADTLEELSRSSSSELFQRLFIITTKQERFVRAILGQNNIHILNKGSPNSISKPLARSSQEINIERSNIFDLDNVYGSKLKVLEELYARITSSDDTGKIPTIHFVEDRFETLVGIIKLDQALRELQNTSTGASSREQKPFLSHLKLYLADWGYNTKAQREEAKSKYSDQIKLIDQTGFKTLVKAILPP